MSVRFAHPDLLEVGSLQGRERFPHASEGMRNAYVLTSGKVCNLRNDLNSARMQNAYMAAAPNNLQAWRKFRHLTQEELADKVGTTKAVISNLETGARGLSDKWLRRLAPVLDTSPGYLMDHDPNDLPTAVLDIWAQIPEADRATALRVLEGFKKTGTHG